MNTFKDALVCEGSCVEVCVSSCVVLVILVKLHAGSIYLARKEGIDRTG